MPAAEHATCAASSKSDRPKAASPNTPSPNSAPAIDTPAALLERAPAGHPRRQTHRTATAPSHSPSSGCSTTAAMYHSEALGAAARKAAVSTSNVPPAITTPGILMPIP